MRSNHLCSALLTGALILAGLTLPLLPAPAPAGGFRLPDVSPAGLALSNAVVANPVDDAAITVNPAAMAFQPGGGVIGTGVMVIDFGTEVTRAGGTTKSDSNTPTPIPSIWSAVRLNDTITAGVNINVPFGLSTRWPDGTFANPDNPTLTRLKVVNISPNVAVKLGDATAVSVGLAHYRIADVVQESPGVSLEGTGDETGYQLGVMHVGDGWSLGAAYRSQISVPVGGTLNGALPVTVDLHLPDLFQVGARFQVTDDIAIEYDIERTGWSAYDTTRVVDGVTGATLALSNNYWSDTTTHRVGLTWRVSGATDLMFGYLNDQTPQPDDHFSPRLPGLDYQGLTVGVAHRIDDIRLVASYMYLDFADRDVNSGTPYAFPADANGTNVYNGHYASYTHQIGLGVSARF